MDLAKVKQIADNVDALKGRMDSYAERKADAEMCNLADAADDRTAKTAAVAKEHPDWSLSKIEEHLNLKPENLAKAFKKGSPSRQNEEDSFKKRTASYEARNKRGDSKKADASGKWEVVVDYKDARDVLVKKFDKEFDAMRFADEKSDLKEVFEVTVHDPNGKQKKF